MIYRQLLAFLLSFVLIFSSTSALAASPAGWSATAADAVMAGATATITAFKNKGGQAMKAVITHKPTAVAVGKELVKGGGVIALAYAMSKLLDAGVDWVLDPANNRVKYTVPAAVGDVKCSVGGWGYGANTPHSTPQAMCNYLATSAGFTVVSVEPKYSQYVCNLKRPNGSLTDFPMTNYGECVPAAGAGSTAPIEKYIPIDTVAAEVLANAEAGHAESQDFVKAVAVGAVDAGELDTALDAVAEPTTDTANPDAPTDPTKPFDPSGILDALKKILAALGLLSVLGTISDSLTAMFEWFKSEPDKPEKPEDNKIDIPEPPLPDIDSTISFGGACPADLGADFNLYGTNFNFVLMPFSKLCPLLSTFVKPTLILLGSFMAVAIVGGRKDA